MTLGSTIGVIEVDTRNLDYSSNLFRCWPGNRSLAIPTRTTKFMGGVWQNSMRCYGLRVQVFRLAYDLKGSGLRVWGFGV